MKESTFIIKLIIFTDIAQLLVLGICFCLFSSKIRFIPWYSPLTSYIILNLIILFVIQVVMTIYIWFMWEKYPLFKCSMIVCSINTIIVLSMFTLALINITLFNIFITINTLFELVLFIYLLYSSINILKYYILR